MIIKDKKSMTIFVEESKKKKIRNPDYLLQMDKIFFKDGSYCVVTKANQKEIEITKKVKIKKEDVSKFLEKSSYVLRAECFEPD